MKTLTLLAGLSVAMTAPAMAATGWHHANLRDDGQRVIVLDRNKLGRASEVKIGGSDYAVCMGKTQDECVNPRQAGLGFGDIPLGYFPAGFAD